MLKAKAYKTFDLILLSFRIIPFQTISSIIYMIINALLPAYQTLVIANFINTAKNIFNQNTNYSSIYMPIILIMTYILFIHISPNIMQIIDITGKNKLSVILKKELVIKRARLEYQHIENNETWELINRVCADPVGRFSGGFDNILNGISLLVTSCSLLIIVMSSTFITGIVIIVVSIPLFYLAIHTGKQNHKMYSEAQKIQRKYNYIAEILTSRDYAEERNLFKYSSLITNRFDSLYDESYKIEKKIQIKSFINLKSGSIITLIIAVIIVGLLIQPLSTGQLSIGVFIALTTAIFNLVQSMSWQLSDTMQEHARVKEYLKDFSDFIQLSNKEDACVIPVDIKDFVFQSLEFKNVSFMYPGTDHFVLNNCSFKLEGNKNYAFVGQNGAGKTTIIKLLVGLYDNYEGEILINEINLRDYHFAKLKGLISVVYQDFARYSLTIKDNICIGNILKDDEIRVKKIIGEVNLEETVEHLEQGIYTNLGKIKTNSIDISGGQWQRLAIARLLYADSKINILDEPTAALDPLEESNIYNMFKSVNRNRFTIYITHRLGAAKVADEILVVDNGCIKEQGPHEQLISYEDGIYKEMFNSQKSWYKTDML